MTGVAESVDSPTVHVVEYVVKIASRCNLACDHCYVYQDPDRGWLAKPVAMDLATARVAGARIAEHAARHGLAQVAVILHGGEPLLLPVPLLAQIMAEFRSAIEPVCRLDLRLQSNGILLTPEIAELLADQHVVVGISLDGDEQANDRHRIYLNGMSSHTQVLRALKLLRTAPYRSLYGGILCTVDVDNDPIRVYEALLREEPPRVDFLLPHATWDNPPPGRNRGSLRYAEWLLTIYQRWNADGRPVRIRIFDSILGLAAGETSGTESLGVDTGAVAVVETDGTWEQVDSLKTVSAEAPLTGLDVHRHSVDDFLAQVGVPNRDGGALPLACRTCPVVDTCGGGLYAHRFSHRNGYANPSVYCADLFSLIHRVQRTGMARPAVRASAAPRPRTLERHLGPAGELPVVTLHDLASGRPTTDSLDRLVTMEYAIDRALVTGVAAALASGPGRAAWQLLGEIDKRSPAAVREVLSHPFVRVRARRSLTSQRADSEPTASVALVTSLAAAAAVRAGSPISLDVRLDRGTLVLPGIGALHLPGVDAAVLALTGDPLVMTVRPEHGPSVIVTLDSADAHPDWHPIAVLDVGGSRVRLDDADPDRDCFRHPVTGPLSDAAALQWSAALTMAWAAVRADAPEQARTMDRLITTVTPTRPVPGRAADALTIRAAFGAVAMPLASPPTLGALLVEQVAKLTVAAVQDICELYDGAPAVAGRSARRVRSSHAVGLAQAFARTARLELMIAHLRAGRSVDRASMSRLRDSLAGRLDCLDRGDRWTEAGRVLLTGLRSRLDRVAVV